MTQLSDSTPAVLFIGSFRPMAGDGTVGGQMFACRSLVDSPLKERVRWRLLDTTMRSLPPPGMFSRAMSAGSRLLRAAVQLARPSTRAVLVFSSYNVPSLLEKGSVCLIARMLGKRVVLSLRSEVSKNGSQRLRRWSRIVFEACDTIVCQSSAARDGVLSHLDGAVAPDVVIVRNWIDPEAYRATGPSESSQRFRFLFLGWVQPSKGTREMVAAAAKLRDAGCNFQIEVLGSGPGFDELKRSIEELKLQEVMLLRGWVHGREKIAALHCCDALLLPSHTEGMPNSVLEAMTASKAVIATNVGGTPELVEQERTGILVAPRDVDQLALAMRRLIDDPSLARSMGTEGRRRVQRYHEIEGVWPLMAKALGIDIAAEKAIA